MGIKTEIAWCDSTLNLAVGCDGCELSGGHCYAEQLVARFAGKPGWPKAFHRPELYLDRLKKALQWPDLTGKQRPNKPWLNGRPRMIFLNDLSDAFCESLDGGRWLHPLIGEMANSPHIWMFLTKRPETFRGFVRHWLDDQDYPARPDGMTHFPGNIWGGTSVTRQDTLWRAEELMKIPLAKRFLSIEPLLGPLDLQKFFSQQWGCARKHRHIHSHLDGTPGMELHYHHDEKCHRPIDWIIVGGESGFDARPMHPEWVRKLRNQCEDAVVRFFFKQWGEWSPKSACHTRGEWNDASSHALVYADGKYTAVLGRDDPDEEFGLTCADLDGNNGAAAMAHRSKHAAGRLLDGREWLEVPTALDHTANTGEKK